MLCLLLLSLPLPVWAQSLLKVTVAPDTMGVFFVDSVNISREELIRYRPEDIALITIYKGAEARRLAGNAGSDGVLMAYTKVFCQQQCHALFSSRSDDYKKAFPLPQDDSAALYILDGKIVQPDNYGKLAAINKNNLINIQILDQQIVKKRYPASSKTIGVVITSTFRPKPPKGQKK